MNTSQRIASSRKRAKLTLQEVAERLGISYQAVQQWEKEGGTAPRGKRLTKLAEILDVPPSYIQFGHKIGEPDPVHKELIQTFDALNEDNRAMVMGAMKFLLVTQFTGDMGSYARWEEQEKKRARIRGNRSKKNKA